MNFEPIIGILCLVSLSLIPFLWSWTLWMIISYFQMFPWGKSIEQGRWDQGNSGILQAELGEPDLGSLPLLRKRPQLVKCIHHELPYGQPHRGFDMLENIYEMPSSLVANLCQVDCLACPLICSDRETTLIWIPLACCLCQGNGDDQGSSRAWNFINYPEVGSTNRATRHWAPSWDLNYGHIYNWDEKPIVV